jgi:hypothetical protein
LAHLSRLTVTQSRPATGWLTGFLCKSVNNRRTTSRFSSVREDRLPVEFLSYTLPASRMHAARHMQFVCENTRLKECTRKWTLTRSVRLWHDATFGGEKNIRSAREELVLPFHVFLFDCHTRRPKVMNMTQCTGQYASTVIPRLTSDPANECFD